MYVIHIYFTSAGYSQTHAHYNEATSENIDCDLDCHFWGIVCMQKGIRMLLKLYRVVTALGAKSTADIPIDKQCTMSRDVLSR